MASRVVESRRLLAAHTRAYAAFPTYIAVILLLDLPQFVEYSKNFLAADHHVQHLE